MAARPIPQVNLHRCIHASMIVQGPSFQRTLSAFLYTSQASAVYKLIVKVKKIAFFKGSSGFQNCVAYLLVRHVPNFLTMPVFW